MQPKERIASLADDLQPLADVASRNLKHGASLKDGVLTIAPTTWVGPQANAIWIYEPLPDAWLPAGLACPDSYRAILRQMNGCFAFGLSLYGIPSPTGQLVRSTLRPLSLELANSEWHYEYSGGEHGFHFGGAVL